MKHCEQEFPARPYVPPTAFLALGVCCSAALLLDAGWHRRAEAGIVPLGLLGALIATGVVFVVVGLRLRDRVRIAVLFAAAGVIAGAAFGTLWLARWQRGARSLEGRSVSSFDLIVRGDPSVSEFGSSSSADVIDREAGRCLATVRLSMDAPIEDGARIRAVGRIEKLDDSDWARSRFMKGEVAAVQVVKVLDEDADGSLDAMGALRKRALEVIGPVRSEARALLAGTICGRTTELNQTDAQVIFSRCGLSHLVAVSGSHLAFIALLMNAVMARMGVSGAVQRMCTLAVMVGYVAFTGFAASAIRSVLMAGTSMASVLLGRRAHPLSGLALAVSGLVLLNPGIVYDLGFQLSVMSVLFLLLFGGYVSHQIKLVGLPALVAEPLALTLVAQWATLPVTVPVFGEVSVVAPVANLAVGPMMSALLVVGLVTVPLAMLGMGVALAVPDLLAQVSLFAAELCSGLPYAAVALEATAALPLVAYGLAVAVFVVWRPFTRASLVCAFGLVACLAAGHVIRWSLFAPAGVTVLDVGQGDAILVREGSRCVLVDAGVDDAVVAALARHHVFSIDAVVVTHWDRDHWGGLPDVLNLIDVDCLVVAEGAADNIPTELTAWDGEIVEVSAGDVLRLGGFSCEAVWPSEPVEGEENAESLCFDVRYGMRGGECLRVLLTGDTEKDELAQYADEVGDIDVLKVGHHGSAASLSAEPLGVLKPELAIASAGEGNSYGHPDPVCIQEAEAAGARFLCTKDVGDIVIEPGEAGPVVRTSRQWGL